MKIMHLIYSLNSGGSENMLVDIVNEQVNMAKVSIVIINKVYNQALVEKVDKRINLQFINRTNGSKNPFSILKLNFLLFKEKADVLHCHNHNIIPLLFPTFHPKAVLTIHCMNIPTKYLGKYKKLFAISDSVRKDVSNRTKINPILIYNGINISSVKSREGYSLSSNFRMICVSRLEHELKGQHLVLEALHILKEKGRTDIHFDLIGTGNSAKFLNDIVLKYDLSNQVSFLGLKDRNYIYTHLKDYDLLIQPSLLEGFGLTIVEGMAAKVPVLVSDIDGPMEIIAGGRFGFYFKKGNEISLAEKILEIIDIYKSTLLQNAIESNFRYVNDNFNISTTASKYLQNYKS